MCGRYTIYENQEALEARFGATFVNGGAYRGLYNAAPSQQLPIILNEHPKDIVLASWGFVPSWAYEGTRIPPAINARGETIAPLFRDAFAHRRCLVLVNGFYEWDRTGDVATPYYITLTGGAPFACAGIWEPPSARTRGVPRFAIITVGANALVSTIHDRLPVVLDEHDEQPWLVESATSDHVAALIAPFNASLMTIYPVSPQVNSSRFESPSAIEPVGER